jgi:hypothetical protein
MALSSSLRTVREELAEARRYLPPSGKDLEIWEAHKADPVRWVHDYGLLRDKAGKAVRLDEEQKNILDPANRRAILLCHRQYGKSSIASLLCFHQALFYPRSLCLLISPSLRQSSENFRKVADALDCIKPKPELEEENKLTLQFSTGSRIISLPGTQKTVRGFTAPDLIFVDEASEAADELFTALFPMFTSNPKGRLIIASTPKGQRGFFHRLWTEAGPDWLKIEKKASENPRLDPAILAEARRALPEWEFLQEYECQFVSDEFTLFDEDRIKRAMSTDFEEIEAEIY